MRPSSERVCGFVRQRIVAHEFGKDASRSGCFIWCAGCDMVTGSAVILAALGASLYPWENGNAFIQYGNIPNDLPNIRQGTNQCQTHLPLPDPGMAILHREINRGEWCPPLLNGADKKNSASIDRSFAATFASSTPILRRGCIRANRPHRKHGKPGFSSVGVTTGNRPAEPIYAKIQECSLDISALMRHNGY